MNVPTFPSGVHAVTAILPPRFTTRAISLAAVGWSGANITPKTDATTSKLPLGKGRSSASPSYQVTSRPAVRSLPLRNHDRGEIEGLDLCTPVGGGKSEVAVSRGHVEDPIPGRDGQGRGQIDRGRPDARAGVGVVRNVPLPLELGLQVVGHLPRLRVGWSLYG